MKYTRINADESVVTAAAVLRRSGLGESMTTHCVRRQRQRLAVTPVRNSPDQCSWGCQYGCVALDRTERDKAADLIRNVLAAVESGNLLADGPSGAATVRRLEGALLALNALDRLV